MKRKTMLFCLYLSCSLGIHSLAATSDLPYKDPKLSVEQRVTDLLGRMTLEEKVAQLNMKSLSGLKTNEKGKVTESSLEALFGERASVAWKVPLSNTERLLLIRKRPISICGQRPGWASPLFRLPSVCTDTWR